MDGGGQGSLKTLRSLGQAGKISLEGGHRRLFDFVKLAEPLCGLGETGPARR